ncbi:DUF6412 domain-containing protein [Streptomyces sp. NPDC020875]|uniref:DUF6412 domain-containing protein n=1 Tax=Streptomyces sp. NPDC020875 TaxID=3154898 RepID=UPI0033C7848D
MTATAAANRAARLVRALLLALVVAVTAFEVLVADSTAGSGGGFLAALALAATATGAVGSALVVSAVISARCAPPVPRTRVRTAIRDRERRTAFLPQRDPDARGRTRPRAPGRALRAVAG